MTKTQPTKQEERAPVVVIVGHVDHGKSTLLDYIRKTKIVESEAGGITQHLSAYEVEHTTGEGKTSMITFLDTPGHEAFKTVRSRGASAADIAILIVSGEEGVKAQTLEARDAILAAGIPYIVAITKIDKPGANVERTKHNLLENEIYLEGLGGDIPCVPISSKSGEGISDLLDMVILVAELQELTGDRSKTAEGLVIEANQDTKLGTSATLLIKNGTLKSGEFVVSGNSIAPTRIMRDFQGKNVKEASFSSPVTVTGFSALPTVGAPFVIAKTKKEAEKLAAEGAATIEQTIATDSTKHTIPVILKADTQGTLDALYHELNKIESDNAQVKIVSGGVGAINESDIKLAGTDSNTVVAGFNVSTDAAAQELARRMNIEIQTFTIIYKLSEWLEEAIKTRTPKQEVQEKHGVAKILKTFSSVKDKHIVGGRVNEGILSVGDTVNIIRREAQIGTGTIVGLQQQKAEAKQVNEGEFGAQVRSKLELAPGDIIESFTIVLK